MNAGDEVVERALRDRLQERKDRRREGRRDAGHLDPDQPVSGANDGLVGNPGDDAEPRPEVELVQQACGTRMAVRPEILELLRLQVEDGGLVVHLGRREVQRVAQAGVDRDPIRETASRPGRSTPENAHGCESGRCCRSIENCCTWPSRKLASGVPVLAMPGRSVKRVLKVKDAGRRRRLDDVQPFPSQIGAQLDRVPAFDPRQRVGDLA